MLKVGGNTDTGYMNKSRVYAKVRGVVQTQVT